MKLAIIGASGLVGAEYLRIIERNPAGIDELIPVASSRSAGGTMHALGRDQLIRDLAHFDFSECDFALFCVGDELSRRFVPAALEAGVAVVDKSNAYRMDPQVPLVVGGVNDDAVDKGCRLVANPNCSTIILCHGLKPLQQFGISRVWVATYQSMSGAGRAGVEKLSVDIGNAVQDASGRSDAEEDSIAHNVIPGIGGLDAELRCSEESKLLNETRKILDVPDLPVIPHAVRVPVSVGHSMAVSVEFERHVTVDRILSAWNGSEDLSLRLEGLPGPLSSSRHEKVEVGRLREEPGLQRGWSFFLSGDNLNIGAALNGWRLLQLLRRANNNQESKAG